MLASTELGPSISLSYQLSRDEVVAALRWEGLHNRRVRLLFGCSVFVLLCGGLLLAGDTGNSAGAFLVGAGGYLVLLVGWVIVRGPQRSWRRGTGIRGPQSFVLAETGVEAHSVIAESKAKWEFYTAAYETPDAYLLRLGNRRAYYIFPKRAFPSPADEVHFRDLVARHTEARFR